MWLRFLDRAVIHRHNGISKTLYTFIQANNNFMYLGTLKRVLLDQLVFSPIFLGVFFIYNHFTENGRLAGISRRFQNVNHNVLCLLLYAIF